MNRSQTTSPRKTRVRSAAILVASVATLIQIPASATDFIKLQNTNALNLSTSWSQADDAEGIPDADDTLVWNSTYTTPGNPRTAGILSTLGGDLSVLGIRITDVGGTRNAASTAVGFVNASSANTLTIGAGGIDMTTATQAFYLESKIALSANQDWIISNANSASNPTGFGNGEDLSLRGMAGSTSAANTSFNLGGFAVTTSGAGAVTVSSGYAITNGTINVGNSLFLIGGGDSRLVTVGSDVNLNVATGSTLHFQSNSAGVTSAANINLNGGTLKLVSNNANAVTLTGTTKVNTASTLLVGNTVGGGSVANANGILFNANLEGSEALTVTNSASTTTPLLLGGNNSNYSGTLTFGGSSGRASRLTTANSGSAAATWSISSGHTLQVNGVTVDLGTLNGAGSVSSSSGAATINVGAGNFSGAIIDGSGTMALTKNTGGTLTLTGVSAYTGPTNVNAGTLLVAPSSLTGTAVSVANGATFGVQIPETGAMGTTVTVPSLDTAAGSALLIDTGTQGSPFDAPLFATSFNPTAGTTIRVLGTNLTTGTFPAIGYTTLGGGGFAGLTLALPLRTTGNLVNNANSIDVNITGISKLTWRGGINGNWDVDTVGNGSVGTANWSASLGPNTYIESATQGNDAVVFDDTATGTKNVNLTTTVSPGNVTVNNTTASYTFAGSGKISGSGFLSKSGTGTLTIANTGTNDYTGGTTIDAGTIRIGDGVTSGAGTLGSGMVTVMSDGILELNRPDDFTFANTVVGVGGLKKSQANTATIPGATTFSGAVTLSAGTLRFTGGGNLSGPISGGGTLAVEGGTLQFSGTDANTMTGTTTVSSGTLQLNKSGVPAIGGTLAVSGSGAVTFMQADQVADTATVTYDKAMNGGTLTFNQADTIGALTILNGHDTGAQVLSNNNGFAVAGLLTVQNTGVYSAASGSSASVGGLNLSGSSFVRVSANSNPTTLTVGALGITANGGTIQVAQGSGNHDAVLNLNGDVTTTGNLAFTDGNYTGTNLRQINIGDTTRTFNIGAGTTTTVAPDIAGTGGITKTGGGTLLLTAASASTYTGDTTVNGGTLLVAGSIAGSTIVNNTGTLGGIGALGSVTVNSGGTLAPGSNNINTLTAGNLALNGTATFALELNIASSNSVTSDLLNAGNLTLDLGNSVALAINNLGGDLTLDLGTTITFLDYSGTWNGGTFAGLADDSTFVFGANQFRISYDGFDNNDSAVVLVAVPEPASMALLLGGTALLGSRRFRRRTA